MDATRYVVAGSFIDGHGGPARRKVAMTIRDGVITAVEPAAAMGDYPRDSTDDLTYATILPPLVDCSVCLGRQASVNHDIQPPPGPGNTSSDKLVRRHLGYYRDHGVLALGDITNSGTRSSAFVDVITRYSLAGAGAGGEAALFENEHTPPVGFLRIQYSRDIETAAEEPSAAQRSTLFEFLRTQGGNKVVAVANGAASVQACLEAGCDAIEQGYAMGEENLAAMAARGILWLPGVVRAKNQLDGCAGGGSVCCRFSQRYSAPGEAVPGAREYWSSILAGQIHQLRKARELGVPVGVATGAGSAGILHGEAVGEEIKLLIKAGYTLEEAIGCASKIGARFLAITGQGALAVGSRATFLVSRGGIKQLPRKLFFLSGLYIDGRPAS